MSLLSKLRTLWNARDLDRELDDELRSHIDMRTEELIASGVPAEAARWQARRAFGNTARVKEEARSFHIVQWYESLAQDLRYGLRQLARNPGFTAVAALTLALGIGANTAIFTAVNAVLLRPLRYADPNALVGLRSSHSLPDILDIATMSKTLRDVGGWAAWYLDLTSGGVPEQIDGALVAGNVFSILGVAPYLGSAFDEAEDKAGKAVVVASYDFWQSHLGGDRATIGRTLQLSGNGYTLLGVMPPGFHLPNSASQLWIPFRVGYPEAAHARGAHFLAAIGRMQDGVTLPQVNEELAAIGRRLGEIHPEEARTFSALGMRARFTGEVRTPLLVLFGAVGLVLLIACSNFAALLLARGSARQDEMQVRSALGARPLRLARQLLTETGTLSLIAGAIAVVLAYACVRALMSTVPDDMTKIYQVGIDRVALAFTLAVSLLTALLFGAVPAWKIAREGQFRAMGARVAGGQTLGRRVLVIVEVALALVLLSAAGLLLRSLWQLQNVPLGMEPDGVLTMRLTLPTNRYGPIERQEIFLARLDELLASVPGVERAALVSELPLSGWRMMHNLLIEGQPPVAPGQEPEIYTHEISPGFFQTLRAPLLLGRNFGAQDTAASPLVAIANEAFVKRYFAGRNPLGAQVRWARIDKPAWMTIVGVARDVRFESMEDPQEPTIYTPFTQKQQVWKRFTAIVVRPRGGDTAAIAGSIKRAIWTVDPLLPVTHVMPMTAVMQESIQQRRLLTMLLAALAGLAVVLATMGVYGVIAYIVAQRQQEVGIRVALGARRIDILWMMVRQALPLLVLGLAAGAAGALAANRVLQKLLYDTTATDAPTLASVAALLTAAALLATLLPAYRATRIDPNRALRAE